MRQRLISPITDGLLSPTSQWLSTEGNIKTTISTSGATIWVAVQYKKKGCSIYYSHRLYRCKYASNIYQVVNSYQQKLGL